MPEKHRGAVQGFVDDLSRTLRENLYSVVVYGSAVRGGFNAQTSDINVLVVLEVSTPESHGVIADAVSRARVRVEPFVLNRYGMERSFRAFAPKFDSLKRHYEVIYGDDPLEDYQSDSELAAFLVEQAIRNLRLRAVQSYIHYRKESHQYNLYLERILPVIFTDLSEVLRLQDIDVPNDFAERVPLIAREYGVEESGLRNLMDLAAHPRGLSLDDIADIHRFLCKLLDAAVSRVSAL